VKDFPSYKTDKVSISLNN